MPHAVVSYDMKRFTVATAEPATVSHNPELIKKVLAGKGAIAGLLHLSHIVLPKGSTAVEHSHPDTQEVFYCIRGLVRFSVNGSEEALGAGECLVVEQGERHSILDVPDEAEMVYFMTASTAS
jgi:quercetin dioxygenase-like cupin family protein